MADEVLTREGRQQGWDFRDSKGNVTKSYLLPVVTFTKNRPDPSALPTLSPAPGSTTAIVKVYAKVDSYDGVPEELQYNSPNYGTFKLVATYKDGKFKSGGSLGSTNNNELLGQELVRWNNASPSNAGKVAPAAGQLLAGANRAASDGGNIPPGRRNKLGLYKGAVSGQPQSPPPDKPPGQSGDDTSDQSGSGVTPATESPFGTVATSEDFQGDNKFKQTEWLRYPIDMNSNQDRIFIVQKRYKSIVGEDGNFDNVNFLDYNTLSRDRNAGKEDILGSVTLPMPNDISETNVTAWGEDSLSTLAGMLGGSAAGFAADFAEGNFGESGATAAKLLGKITDTPASDAIKQMLTLNAGAAIVKKFGVNFNAEAFRSRVTGTAINPNLELLFQGPKLRSFGFQFKMTPRSQDEARNIRYILKFFRKGMASKRSEGQPFFLGAPNVFDIHFKSGEENNDDLKSIGRIKTCALQQCVVNYTPDGFYAAFADQKAGGSQPISVVMQLAFTELTPLYNDDYIDDDTDNNSVGWDEKTTTFKYS